MLITCEKQLDLQSNIPSPRDILLNIVNIVFLILKMSVVIFIILLYFRATFYTDVSPAILEIRDVMEGDATEFRYVIQIRDLKG